MNKRARAMVNYLISIVIALLLAFAIIGALLLWQGVAAFKLFTGKEMPREEVQERFFS